MTRDSRLSPCDISLSFAVPFLQNGESSDINHLVEIIHFPPFIKWSPIRRSRHMSSWPRSIRIPQTVVHDGPAWRHVCRRGVDLFPKNRVSLLLDAIADMVAETLTRSMRDAPGHATSPLSLELQLQFQGA
jgi:hypothetical protein